MSSSFDPTPGTPAERELLEALASAKPVSFADMINVDDRIIRGELLRYLFLTPGRVPLSGLHVRHARIEGDLDLRDFRHAVPGGLPALSIEDSDFTGEIELSFARISRLSLARSRFSKLCLRESDIDGPLDISGVRQMETVGVPATCWVDARDCVVNGEFNASGSVLKLPAPPETRLPSVETRYAMWLRNATIHGSVHLLNGFTATGGVSIETAQVRGNVLGRGAILTACEDDALNGQNVRIGGALILDKGANTRAFRANGRVWLLGARVGTTLQLDGAVLNGLHRAARASWNAPAEALLGSNMEIGTNLRMNGTRVKGQFVFPGSRIGGRLDCSDAVFSHSPTERATFFAPGIRIGGNALFERATVRGGIDLIGAAIGGSLICDGVVLRDGKPARAVALHAMNATMGQDVYFRSAVVHSKPGRDHIREFSACGIVDLTGATIEGGLCFQQASLSNRENHGRQPALRAVRITVKGSLDFRDTVIFGEVDLAAATIGSNLNCKHATFCRTSRSAIYAKDMAVGGDLRLLDQTFVFGDLNLERVNITGRLLWRDLWLIAEAPQRHKFTKIDLQHARIGAVLQAHGLNMAGSVRIDLGGAKVTMVESIWPEGWGMLHNETELDWDAYPINIDGLSYDRIVFKPKPNDASLSHNGRNAQNWLGVALAGWLKRQDRGIPTASFFPQPYRQLTRVLREQGDEDVARFIAVCEWDERVGKQNRKQPEALVRVREKWNDFNNFLRTPLSKAYGLFFGYGLKPRRAFATLVVYVALGTVGVEIAQCQHMLIERPVPVATMAWVEQGAVADPIVNVGAPLPEGLRRVPVLGGQSGLSVADIACSDAVRNTWDALVYAVDMILPFIPLHQETKCEIKADDTWGPAIWRVGRDVYTILGWLISSLALLTVSGFLRKSEESPLG